MGKGENSGTRVLLPNCRFKVIDSLKKKKKHQKPLIRHREFNLVLCEMGWGRVREEGSRGGGICILMADSHRCLAESNTTL